MSVVISPVADIVADMAAGKIVILIDEEDRENQVYFTGGPEIQQSHCGRRIQKYCS